ncbi:unnamed protein product [Camellia sinensis]
MTPSEGHYVVICGYDAMTDEFEIRDPASSGKHEKVTSKRLEEARRYLWRRERIRTPIRCGGTNHESLVPLGYTKV